GSPAKARTARRVARTRCSRAVDNRRTCISLLWRMAAETTGLEATLMRKVTSYLFISLDGVVEAPDTFVRSDLYEDFDPLTAEMIAEQDAVLLGRKTYDDWSVFWP